VPKRNLKKSKNKTGEKKIKGARKRTGQKHNLLSKVISSMPMNFFGPYNGSPRN
jgi:hypothetical protein